MKTFALNLLIVLFSVTAFAQTTASVATGGTGWKRIASIPGATGRGFGTVSLYTIGGSYKPVATTIEWFHDWSTIAGVTVHSDSKSTFWDEVRITDDGTTAYIEVNFTKDITILKLLSDNYGYYPAVLYSGTLPNGGGNIRASASVARLNVENNLVVHYNGNVGIGTATPKETLSVNGTIRSKEIKVEAANWPDYVFDETYKIPSLSDTETYIKEHRHLPGMPNKNQVEKEGVSLGEMNRKLLEKVEELTLHQIELYGELEKVKRELALYKEAH